MNEDDYTELRVTYPGHPYIALIDGPDDRYVLSRRWIGGYFYHRRERLEDGTQEQVYRLPLIQGIWEVKETRDGKATYRYVAVREGDTTLYTLSRDLVEAVVEGLTTFEAAVASCSKSDQPESEIAPA